ncbi:potassium/sodium efflux P-type ATPase [Cokeromyces recurvatus]|uniref:potassium/sodium efflux P-type ATPase n=1 Tax=Cokeromyces recurvatus TaxID=90255 RepID=UPI00221EBFF2|nr:potassium/sodium efflux P-type ATPase [Cokeromyces recurvatus]KAI7899446.1 potassium/sodium efflux P-type ATPase [Cokeromyces recurvatus]
MMINNNVVNHNMNSNNDLSFETEQNGEYSHHDVAQQQPPQTTIKFDEEKNREMKEYQVQYNEKYSQKPLTRQSTGQSSTDFDTKSVRSVLMHKMNLIKRRRKSIDESERVEGPPYHTMDLDTVTQLLRSDLEDGLSESMVDERRSEYGFNEMEGEGGVSPLRLLLKQFLNIMVLILLIAMIVSFVFKDYIEGGVICVIMFLNAAVGFIQEFKAEKTMDSLRQMASPTSQVIRGGHQKTVPTRELLPGDIIILKTGDVVGADCRIIESFNMDVDEALLTGESIPVNKIPDVIQGDDVPLGDRVNMSYSSTVLTKGRGKAIVTAVGMQTEIGKIAKRLLDSGDNSKTPLQKSLDRMALVLLAVAIISLIIVFAAAKFHITNEVVLYAISTSISVIPEGLVAVVTLTQAFGVYGMAKSKALVRRLAALELLGAVTNVCSDKTGTLTQSKMVMTRLWRPDTGFYSVSGIGFAPEGEVKSESDNATIMTKEKMDHGFQMMVNAAALCNMSEVRKDKATGDWSGIGDPTEVALQVFAHKLQNGKPSLINKDNPTRWNLIAEYPFDSSIKRMTVLCQSPNGATIAFLKGATERVLSCCVGMQMSDTNDVHSMSPKEIEEIVLPKVDSLARGGLRVLSLAMRRMKHEDGSNISSDTFVREQVEQEMIFLGLVGIYDPPRLESKMAVEQCHKAGITVHMLTGDHIATATAIAREVSIIPADYGLKAEDDQNQSSKEMNHHSYEGSKGTTTNLVMTAQRFDKLTEEEIDALPELPLVIARCSPDTKVKMIEALHRRKRIAGMTGDGVNDSPSLKEADIGIAMGENGSDVAKQAADIVLVDDNFATIVKAIEEGRRVFGNIARFVVHMVSGNVAELTPLLIGLAFIDSSGSSVFPMTPIQILFNNILTSSPPAMSLGLEPIHNDQMLQPPRSKKEGLFSRSNLADIIFYGFSIGIICLCNFIIVLYAYGTGNLGVDCNGEYNDTCDEVFRARGALFATLTVIVLLHGFTCRDLRNPTWTWSALKGPKNIYLYWSTLFGFILLIVVLYVPFLNTKVFRHKPITWEWGMTVASVILYIGIAESYKWIKRRFF